VSINAVGKHGASGDTGRDNGRGSMEFPGTTPGATPCLAALPPEGAADPLPWWERVSTPPTTLSFLTFLRPGAERSAVLQLLSKRDRGW
jgi:hypothetical protein